MSGNNQNAAELIDLLRLKEHPEGGWYRETWRGEAGEDGRARGTAILFLLERHQVSHWHRVDADELWLWQRGDPLELMIAKDGNSNASSTILGANTASDEHLQGFVPAGQWQAARSAAPDACQRGYTLVSCVVIPGFEFSGFELAPQGWEPGTGDPLPTGRSA